MKIEIRPAVIDDLNEILKIEQVSFRNPFTENLFAMELKLDIAHLDVAKCDGRVVGYIDFWHVGPEIHLINIAVAPDFRRRHVGSVLMEYLVNTARQRRCEEIYLDVRVSNAGAIALYEKYGFLRDAIRKEYYRDNREDAIVMRLRLSSTGAQRALDATGATERRSRN